MDKRLVMFREMATNVLFSSHHLKILDAIIKGVAVDMVDDSTLRYRPVILHPHDTIAIMPTCNETHICTVQRGMNPQSANVFDAAFSPFISGNVSFLESPMGAAFLSCFTNCATVGKRKFPSHSSRASSCAHFWCSLVNSSRHNIASLLIIPKKLEVCNGK